MLRRGIMELLLARCPGSGPVLDLAGRLGVGRHPVPRPGPPGEDCVLCGLCVRVCQEMVGASAIGFAFRGLERRVDSPFSLGSEVCLGCCACLAICPTGAIVARSQADTLNLLPFGISVKLGRCALCGKPVGPLPLLALVGSRLPFPVAAQSCCPDCRADRRARTLASVAPPPPRLPGGGRRARPSRPKAFPSRAPLRAASHAHR